MDYAAARRLMVENQIRTNRVTDPLVIAAMNELPREAFVPKDLQGVAYIDEHLPLGGGRFLMEPLATALSLQTAAIGPEDVVLEIGCGTGYQTAAVARIASAVVAVEIDRHLIAHANRVFADLGLHTVSVVEGPLADGYPRQAPYDVILFGGAVTEIPVAIKGQLADGGRMVAIIARQPGLGRGTLFVRSGAVISHREVFDRAAPVLPGFEREVRFQF